ncbi:hypothetical protein IWW55_002951 [Coemansia sp. RSA 2706]|nr:hypothetical protein LPJ63_003366 [Coemansia sp. RSA 2711]KAJ2303385.1 hypothetical protein IWW55_002951 [Coemansia sp. RSA 2706]
MSTTQQSTANGTAGEAQKVSAQEIGWMFAHEYYSFMNSDPKKLQYFYGKKSTCVHGTEGKIVTQANGQQEIYATIAAEEFQGSQIEVTTVDILPSINGSIIVQVLGKIAKDTQPFRRFAQTFFLAEQPSGYYLHNDILRYLKDDIEDSEPVAAITTATTEAAPEAQPAKEAPKPAVPAAPKKDEKVDPDEAPKPVAAEIPKPAPPVAEKKPEPAPVAENKPKAPKEKPAAAPVAAAEPAKAAEPAAAPTPAKPTSWANLAADGSGRWGSTMAKVEGTVAPATNVAAGGAANPPSRTSTPGSGARESRRKADMPSVFLKNIPAGCTINQLKSAMKKFGPSAYVDYSPSRTTGVAEYVTEEEKKAALDAGEVMINDQKVLIEERRPRQSSGRREGGPGGKQAGGQGSSTRAGPGEFERVGSGRGSRSRTATNAGSSGRPRGGKQ